MQNDEQNTIVEGEDFETRPAVGTRPLLVMALILSLPIYLLILFLTDDPVFTGRPRMGVSRQQAVRKLVVKKVAGMDFEPVETKPINSSEELVAAMICTFEPRSGEIPESIYLRIGSCERFSAGGMESHFSRTHDKGWPGFAFADLPQRFSGTTGATADLHFFCNFEERLPHQPALKSLAGPLNYCAMRDGSIVLDQTIAVGDEFELEYVSVPRLTYTDRFVEVATDSPYLSLGFMENMELRIKVGEIAGDTPPEPQAVLKFVAYLESNGLYKQDYQQITDMHPVKEFLLQSMTGSCQHFAASLVLFCRMYGIPARVANGFFSDRRIGNRFIVVGGMAHAWTEVLTEDGWKSVDVFPQRSESPSPIKKGVALPSVAQLESIKERLKQENAQRYGSGTADSEDSDYAEEPPRMAQKITSDNNFEVAQSPGTVVIDPVRAEMQRREAAEKKLKQKKREQTGSLKKSMQGIGSLLLIAAIVWLMIRNAEIWLKWLMKLVKKKQQQEQEQSDTANEEALRETLAKMSSMKEFELQGKDVIELFNRFTKFMETRGVLPRKEHETSAEYFDRLCVELNLRPADGKIAAQCFEAELYGGQSTKAAAVQKFLHFLQQILNKIS